MKIVVLDGFTLNPGDLSWDVFHPFGEITVYDRTPFEKMVERAKEADIILTNKTALSKDVLHQCPHVKYIGVLATGYDVVDIEAAKQKGIIVTNIPAYGTDSVAQLTFAFILELCHRVELHSQAVHQGEWGMKPDFSFWIHQQLELAGKTIGIVGYGTIGEQVARIADAFGMNIVAYRRHPSGQPPFPHFQWVDLDELLERSDMVTLHCPLTQETEGMMNKASLGKMKQTAFLINTARGKLIIEEDLRQALETGQIAGAGLDVLSSEPPPPDHPLIGVKNCIITPHLAWATLEARRRLMSIAAENVRAYLSGEPQHVVNA